jgi:hypothetical protein
MYRSVESQACISQRIYQQIKCGKNRQVIHWQTEQVAKRQENTRLSASTVWRHHETVTTFLSSEARFGKRKALPLLPFMDWQLGTKETLPLHYLTNEYLILLGN